jgi:hypothetical protein
MSITAMPRIRKPSPRIFIEAGYKFPAPQAGYKMPTPQAGYKFPAPQAGRYLPGPSCEGRRHGGAR